ncbi:MAG: hypothetical protein AABX85_04240 [Nanoarchaeota archaeon]
MKFPEKFIKRGKFKLHSGEESSVFYDVNSLLTDSLEFQKIISTIPRDKVTYVGIATGGAIIARHFSSFAMIKKSELKGEVGQEYCLIDDVCTTEGSLREAISIIGKEPKYIFVVVDRRKEKNLKLISVYDVSNQNH